MRQRDATQQSRSRQDAVLSFLFLPVRPGSDRQSTKRAAKHENMKGGCLTNQMFQITVLHFKKVDDLSRPNCSIVACVHAALSCCQGVCAQQQTCLLCPKLTHTAIVGLMSHLSLKITFTHQSHTHFYVFLLKRRERVKQHAA